MIQANELRIGNFVGHEGEDTIYEADHITIRMSHNYIPIPLTEEWLLRFGLRSHPKTGSSFLHWNFKDIEEMENALWSNGDAIYLEHFGTSIKYVHQLQNIYFALTGEELTLK